MSSSFMPSPWSMMRRTALRLVGVWTSMGLSLPAAMCESRALVLYSRMHAISVAVYLSMYCAIRWTSAVASSVMSILRPLTVLVVSMSGLDAIMGLWFLSVGRSGSLLDPSGSVKHADELDHVELVGGDLCGHDDRQPLFTRKGVDRL